MGELVVQEDDLVGEGIVAPVAIGVIGLEGSGDAIFSDVYPHSFGSRLLLEWEALALTQECVLDLGKPCIP